MTDQIDIIRQYLAAIADGRLAQAMDCLHPDVEQIEHPNAIKPKGDFRRLPQLAADFERGRAMFASQVYDVRHTIDAGDEIAVEVHWEGVLAKDTGPLPADARMAVESAMFFRLREGRIIRQTNYDCVRRDAS